MKLTGIHNTDLLGQPPLSVVLRELLQWITNTTEEHNHNTGRTHFPGISPDLNEFQDSLILLLLLLTVLVAHNGFKFDFPLLFAEIDRREEHLNTSILCTNNIHFGDTLVWLKQVC